jgi:hypothetical protein
MVRLAIRFLRFWSYRVTKNATKRVETGPKFVKITVNPLFFRSCSIGALKRRSMIAQW